MGERIGSCLAPAGPSRDGTEEKGQTVEPDQVGRGQDVELGHFDGLRRPIERSQRRHGGRKTGLVRNQLYRRDERLPTGLAYVGRQTSVGGDRKIGASPPTAWPSRPIRGKVNRYAGELGPGVAPIGPRRPIVARGHQDVSPLE